MNFNFAYLTNTTINGIILNNENIGTIISTIITGAISIFGFFITYFSMTKSFKNESKKQRASVALDNMSTMPLQILDLLDELLNMSKTSDKKNINLILSNFQKILNTIYSYGSENAIKIASTMQKENYAVNSIDKLDSSSLIALYVLLATQIKYDVTEIAICPQLWYEMRLTDYAKTKHNIIKSNNQIVSELKLKEEFKIIEQ